MGAITLLQHCKDLADLEGLPEPSSVMATSDPELRKLRAIAQQAIYHIASRHSFDWNVRQTRWKQVAAQTSVVNRTLAEIAKQDAATVGVAQVSADIHIIPDTLWNLSKKQQLNGPLTPQERSAVTVIGQGGAFYNYWVENDCLCLYPYLPVGDEIQLAYRDARGVVPANTVPSSQPQGTLPQFQARFMSDGDRPACADDVFALALQWKWRERNGFPFDAIFNEFELAITRDSSKAHHAKFLVFDSGPRALQPGIVVNGIPVPPSVD